MRPAFPIPEKDTVGFVLAGGRSTRMGRDKALVRLEGRTLVDRALETLREAGLNAMLAGASFPPQGDVPVVQDSRPGLGLLGGIYAALASTDASRVVFLPVDLPLLPSSLIAFLLDYARTTEAAVTVCSVNGFAQTLPAVVDRAVLPALETELGAGRLGCYFAFQAAAARIGQPLAILPVEVLVQAGQATHPHGLPAVRWFLNLNYPADLLFAERLTLGGIA